MDGMIGWLDKKDGHVHVKRESIQGVCHQQVKEVTNLGCSTTSSTRWTSSTVTPENDMTILKVEATFLKALTV